jgi:hypothetical protein
MPILSLRISFADSRWSWFLKDHDEIDVYMGAELVTTLAAAVLRQMVGHYLAQARLTASVLEGPGAVRHGLSLAPRHAALLPVGLPSVALQEARKAKRRARLPRPLTHGLSHGPGAKA